jgi:hypothetical protein
MKSVVKEVQNMGMKEVPKPLPAVVSDVKVDVAEEQLGESHKQQPREKELEVPESKPHEAPLLLPLVPPSGQPRNALDTLKENQRQNLSNDSGFSSTVGANSTTSSLPTPISINVANTNITAKTSSQSPTSALADELLSSSSSSSATPAELLQVLMNLPQILENSNVESQFEQLEQFTKQLEKLEKLGNLSKLKNLDRTKKLSKKALRTKKRDQVDGLVDAKNSTREEQWMQRISERKALKDLRRSSTIPRPSASQTKDSGKSRSSAKFRKNSKNAGGVVQDDGKAGIVNDGEMLFGIESKDDVEYVKPEIPKDPNFKLQFEKGGWGEWCK